MPTTTEHVTAWRTLHAAHVQVETAIDRALDEACGLNARQFDVLAYVNEPDSPRRMNEVAEATCLSPSGLTRVVDSLVARGLVHRVRSEDDRRGVFLGSTAGGREIYRAMLPMYEAAVAAALSPVAV